VKLPFVSVIIPVLDDPDRLALCIDALRNQTYAVNRFEVWVIDNGSRPEKRPAVPRVPDFHLIEERKRGPYAARNTGVAHAKADLLVFTDADAIPAPDWLEKGVEALRQLSGHGLVGGRVELFFRNPARPNVFERFESQTYLQQRKHVEQEHFAATANLFTWRSVFEAAGGFDERLIANGDRIFGETVHALGYPLVFAEDATVRHPARATYTEFHKRVVRNFAGFYLVKVHRGYPLDEWLADLWTDLLTPVRAVRQALNHPEVRGFRASSSFVVLQTLRYYIGMIERIRLRLGFSPRW
jgi:glycosyltransferase involved in cell wall biosynthesis